MSLADQQWCPTSVQVTVLQARGLRIKGKSGTNDAYAVMQVGKEKFQTSVVEKSVAPVWKEEAAFDLPPLHQGGTERSTLHVHVLHRALVGPDKLLGQAVINLLQLSEDKTRNKTEWFKLLDKTGKADKDRGEVLVDIQFMRNNMTASMFDLSAAGKSRSRLGKFKDKVRGKKKESDAASTVVPSLSQVLTDSEEEGNGDSEVAAGKDEKKKKLKMKSMFSPKSNLQRNMSQSMSVLPAKNSSLSGSQLSGLNVDSSEGKKKFKFMIHKRSGSSDIKDSSSGHQKHGAAEQSNLCINGSHVYCEEPQPQTSRIGSNFSLTSSGHGSMEDVPESSPPSVDSLREVRQYSPWTEEEEEETSEVEDVGKLRREEEERIRMEEVERRKEKERVRKQEVELGRLAEKKRQEEEERVKREEEERIRREEEERAQEERMRHEEEERVRREEELERLAEENGKLEEQRRRIEEEEKRQREEEARMKEIMAQEERMKQEERKLEEEKRLEEERIEEERRRREEEEMVRKQEKELEEKRRLEEQKRRQREEEERIKEEEAARREMEEYERLVEEERQRIEAEEKIRVEEERRTKEEEERVRRQEERDKLEKKRILEEQERRNIEEEEKRRREEEERIGKEEERVRRQEELERLAEDKRRQREEERRTEEEKAKREERIRKEEAERAREENEEMERLAEKRRLEEQEKRSIEDRIRREEKAEKERKQEQARKLEKEKLVGDEGEQKRENATKHLTAVMTSEVGVGNPAEVPSNSFDETFSNNPFEDFLNSPAGPDSSAAKVSTVQQRCQSAVSSVGSKTITTDVKDLISSQREKRLAPQPPGRNKAESQREQDGSTQHLEQIYKQSKDKDVKTVSVLPQRSVQMIAPLSRSPMDTKNTQSLAQSSTTKETTDVAKHRKRPAPSRPGSVEEGPSTEPKTTPSSDGNISHDCGSEAKQEPIVYGLNPFEDDENELTAQDDATTSGKTGSIQWPPAVSQGADKDAAFKTQIKSSKVARAPPLPAKQATASSTLINQNTEGGHVTDDKGVTVPDNHVTHACDPKSEAISRIPVQEDPLKESRPATVHSAGEEAGGKKGPLTTPRRLQPVKPLNPLEQQSVSVLQGEKDNKSTGVFCEFPKKTKVNDTGLKGPYSQLTQEELISLVLKQKNELSERDKKISELEQYIDNLLVRVIEEKPSILMSLSSLRKSL